MGHVHFHVGDLDAAAAFYHAGLGLDRVVLNFPGALFLSAGGYHHHLGTNVWAAGAPTATAGDARLVDWTLRLPGASAVAAAARSLARGGHRVRQDAGETIATDPWGIEIRLAPR
jgi:catechol 2,3-dioxygenase